MEKKIDTTDILMLAAAQAADPSNDRLQVVRVHFH